MPLHFATVMLQFVCGAVRSRVKGCTLTCIFTLNQVVNAYVHKQLSLSILCMVMMLPHVQACVVLVLLRLETLCNRAVRIGKAGHCMC